MISFKLIRSILASAVLSVLITIPIEGWAQNNKESLKELLENRDDEIKELLGPKGTEYTQEQRDKLKDIINGVMDFRAMAEYALEKTYENLSASERSEFVELFSTVIRDQSLNKLDIYRSKVIYNSIEVNGNSAIVNTTAQLEDVRTPVNYKMEYDQSKSQWVVTDLIIDDVSTAGSYRRQFQNIIRKKGYDSLLQTLRKRAGKTT